MTERAQNADFRRKLQIFADSALLLEVQAFGGCRKPQKTADVRRKTEIFAENCRKPQIRLRHLRCVTLSSALDKGSALPSPTSNATSGSQTADSGGSRLSPRGRQVRKGPAGARTTCSKCSCISCDRLDPLHKSFKTAKGGVIKGGVCKPKRTRATQANAGFRLSENSERSGGH